MSQEDVPQVAQVITQIQDVDKMALELAKSRRHVALAQAEKALAQNETAEIAYKYVVLQLYMKYGLSETDAIDDNGKILRGGAPKNQ
jgi:hypothetical protein